MTDLEEKLKCVLADVGTQVGEILSCIIRAEIAAQLSKAQQLQAILAGETCTNDATTTAIV